MNGPVASELISQMPPGYRMDRRLGPVYEETPAGADDLTLIRGIGTREAVALNRLGVYFLPQIALWSAAEVAAFADELGMQASKLRADQWVQQARSLLLPAPAPVTPRSSHLPASFLRTITLLACAVLIGCFVVYSLSLRSQRPIHGTLSAEITSLRVPTDARLVTSHVIAGDEVYSGDSLLTLEKTEHLAVIARQEQLVRELGQELQKAEAQASLDLQWRTRELDRELSDIRTRAQLIREVKRTPVELHRSAALPVETPAIPVSQTKTLEEPPPVEVPRPSPVNGLVFISGESGAISPVKTSPVLRLPAPPPRPKPAPAPVKVVMASEPAPMEEMWNVESQSIQLRLERLEQLRAELPAQVRQAAGVDGVQTQLDEASERLQLMRSVSREVSVVCPAYGKVGQIRYSEGDQMTEGEVMVKILHTDQRFIVAYVPTSRLDEVEPGALVTIIFPGNREFRGTITNLPMLAEPPTASGKSFASVRVEPAGRLWPDIPVGSQVDILLSSGHLL